MFSFTLLPLNGSVRTVFLSLFCFSLLAGCAARTETPVAPVVVAPPTMTTAARTPRVKEQPALVDASHVKLTSSFGPRKIGKRSRMHKGIDLKAAKGCAVLAYDAGEVIVAGTRRGYGQSVDVQHSDGTVTRYAHLSKIAVKRGDRVAKGEALGAIGRTGRASANHLHFEILKNGKAVDPLPFLHKNFAQLISPDTLSRVMTADSGRSKQTKTAKR